MNLSTSGMAGSEKMIKYKDLSVTQESDYKEFKQQDMHFTENKPNVWRHRFYNASIWNFLHLSRILREAFLS